MVCWRRAPWVRQLVALFPGIVLAFLPNPCYSLFMMKNELLIRFIPEIILGTFTMILFIIAAML